MTRWHDQAFSFRDGKFKSKRNILSKLFSAIRFDGIGKPIRDAELARDILQRRIDEVAPDVQAQSLIVFVDPAAEIEFETEPALPVLYADPKRSPNLKTFMRDAKRQLADPDGKASNAALMPPERRADCRLRSRHALIASLYASLCA